MKTKEVKFKTHQELYAWAATGKPIRYGNYVFTMNSEGRYIRNKSPTGTYMAFSAPASEYIGIEEIPTKKAYAYWQINGNGANTLVYMSSDQGVSETYGYERCPEFDLEARE